MCGFCFEALSLDLTGVYSAPESTRIYHMLQETVSLQEAVDLAVREDCTTSPSFLARLTGTIARDPDSSAVFRRMLLEALDAATPATIMPTRYMQWLSGEQVAGVELLEVAVYHLKEFTDWWFGRQIIPRDVTMDKGVWDPITALPKENYKRLVAVVPAVMMSLGVLRRLGSDHRDTSRLLAGLAATHVPSMPFFDGLDLWIQRVAILDYFDLFGADGLLERPKEIRSFLWAYLVVKRGLSAEIQSKLDGTFGKNWMDHTN